VSVLGWIVVGFVAGVFAKAVTRYDRRTPAHARIGCLGTIAIGVLGGLIGGALSAAATGEKITHFGLRSIAIAFVGAVLLLLVVEAITARR